MALISSEDAGLTWTVLDPELIAPQSQIENSWKRSYIYGFDAMVDPTAADDFWVFYNARNGWKNAVETIGVSKYFPSKM